MAEITDKGYILKTQNEYFEQERQLYLDIDADWNLDPSTPDGLKIAHDAETFANLDEVLQRAYNSKNPNAAKGSDLDLIAAITGTYRDDGIPSTVPLILGGVAGSVIFEGDIVEAPDKGTQWTINDTVTIGVNGQVAAVATCTENGQIEAAIGTVNKIVTTRAGWQTVTNAQVAQIGRDRQTDASLRAERRNSVARAGFNMVESIYGEVNSVENVRRVKIYENEDVTTDANGLPSHSLLIVVDGGDDTAVAQAIYNKRGPGPTQWTTGAGTVVTKTVKSLKYPEISKEIKFCRPINVTIDLQITITNDGTLPSGIEDEIKASIVDYANGVLADETGGFNYRGFGFEEDVHKSRIYTPVNKVIGKYGDSYVDSITVNGGDVQAVGFAEIARFSENNITITVS